MGQQISDRHNLSRQMKVNEDGSIDVNAELEVKDIQIGAVEIKDGETDARQKVKSDGTDNASVVTQNTQPLPTGAATSAKQDTLITELQLKADLTEIQPVSVASSVVYGTRIDEATSTVTYIGKATPGTATSVSLWQIQKIDTTTGTVITWADGNGDFDNVWDNRTSLTYS